DGETSGTSGGDEPGPKGEESAETKGPIPYSRFEEIVRKNQALERENTALKASTIPAKTEGTGKDGFTKYRRPDKQLTQDEAFDFYAKQSIDNYFAQEFGSKDIVRSAIAEVARRRTAEVVSEFVSGAKERGLNPASETLRNTVAHLLDSGKVSSM